MPVFLLGPDIGDPLTGPPYCSERECDHGITSNWSPVVRARPTDSQDSKGSRTVRGLLLLMLVPTDLSCAGLAVRHLEFGPAA
jgi:hypothetical protein